MKKIPDDPRFRHVDLHHTDLRTTFARIKREQAKASALKAKPTASVRQIRKIVP